LAVILTYFNVLCQNLLATNERKNTKRLSAIAAVRRFEPGISRVRNANNYSAVESG
jgi:hypothetical protein